MKKVLITSTALILLSSASYAQECNQGAVSCNIASVGDKTLTSNQDVGDHLNNTYAPDSSSSSSSVGDIKNVAQGGSATGGNSYGNTSNNQSSANNSATNNMTNGSINNSVTGGNISSSGGNISGGSLTQNGSADIVNSGGNVTGGQALTYGGQASTNSGSINTAGGSVGDTNASSSSSASTGASTSSATGGAGGEGGRASSTSVSRSGDSSVRSSGNSRNSNVNNIDASQRTTIKQAAAMSSPVAAPGYGPQNCFGDTNPSGSFGASFQTFGFGASASSQKASNICAIVAIVGPQVGAAYLAEMDPNARRAMLNNGYAITKEEKMRRDSQSVTSVQSTTVIKNQRLACPSGYSLIDTNRGPKCRLSTQVEAVRETSTQPPVVCPAGSSWDGKGCWMPGKR